MDTRTPSLDFIRLNRDIFARCGSVVASFRTRGSSRFGPYYRVAYRADGRQRSVYLGRSLELAKQARDLLANFQEPRNFQREVARCERRHKAQLLQVKRQWQKTLRACGLNPRGWDARGWRALGFPRIDKRAVTLRPIQHKKAQQESPVAKKTSVAPPSHGTHKSSAAPRYRQNQRSVDQLTAARLSSAGTCSPNLSQQTRYWQNPLSVDQHLVPSFFKFGSAARITTRGPPSISPLKRGNSG